MKVKLLEIEVVTNGWIVRPYTIRRDYDCASPRPMWVFRDLADLQAQLPAMLEWEESPEPSPKAM